MKATGCVRKPDPLGRFVIPVRLRKKFGIEHGDDIELFVDGECIVLKKFTQPCIFCGQTEDICEYRGKYICDTCMISLRHYDMIKGLYRK